MDLKDIIVRDTKGPKAFILANPNAKIILTSNCAWNNLFITGEFIESMSNDNQINQPANRK